MYGQPKLIISQQRWILNTYLRRLRSSLSFRMTFLRALGFLALGVSLSLPRLTVGAEVSKGLSMAAGECADLPTTLLLCKAEGSASD